MFNQDRLSGSDFSGDDDEAFGVVQAIYQIGHCLPVHRAFVKETRIRSELKRRCGKAVELGVHRRQNVLLNRNAN